MLANEDVMRTALRVLMAITERVPPSKFDAAKLRRVAPEHANCAIDDLACAVIKDAIRAGQTTQKNRGVRGATGGRRAKTV